jgi:hypothetical protein
LITATREEIVTMPKVCQKGHKRFKESAHSNRITAVKKRASDDPLLQPWFLSMPVAKAILRLIPAEYVARMRWYFEDYGCICCKRKKVMYYGNGFCIDCGPRVRRRLVQSMKRRGKTSIRRKLAESQKWYFNRAKAAQGLFADLIPNKPRLIAGLPQIEAKRTRGKPFWQI